MESSWDKDKAKLLLRLHRIEGQVRGVTGMIVREDDCEGVVQQFAAIRKAMDRAFFDLMSCVTKRELAAVGAHSREASARIDAVASLLAKYG